MKGYKVFNSDFTCRGFQFSENSDFKFDGKIKICSSGFHFCIKAQYCFNYYSFDPNNIICEVEALGETQIHDEDSKVCTNHLRVGKKLTWNEVLFVANVGVNNTGYSNSGDRNSGYRNSGDSNSGHSNSGDRNSGYRNSGHRNSGHRNSGDSNSGNWNSGNWNSGNWNSGSWNSGHRNSGDSNSGYRNSGAFCTDVNPILLLFNKPCKNMTVRDWENSNAVELMNSIAPSLWIPWSLFTEDEKKANPKYEASDGYVKTISLKEAWANAWNNWSDQNKNIFLSLENFDAKIFEEITGIKIK